MCPVGLNNKTLVAYLDTLTTPTAGLSHVRMALARLAVSDCAPQTSRVSSNLHSSSSMAVSRVPSPPPPEVNTPVAENWCYTQRLYRTMTPTLDDDNPSGVVGPSRQELAE
ncbi:hypothetical protein PV327_002117 [Microctonus hyperodae]|uniref:Uncharacterized protein n=1 Tax=Microctonus hyperodae TaxID=165561 RepID=A0AA39KNU5_MICHY|nr:hypothetical protein PV327_002117 [Microctonus hyperodae]